MIRHKKANTLIAYWLFLDADSNSIVKVVAHLILFTIDLYAIDEATALDTGRLNNRVALAIKP